MAQVEQDLNTTIAAAVNARVEAAVLESLAGDAVIGQYVTAALQEPTKDPWDSYNHEKRPWLTFVVRDAIRDATKVAVHAALAEEKDAIEKEVRRAIKARISTFATQVTEGLLENTKSGYNIKVDFSR